MRHEFVVIDFPCKTCLVQACCLKGKQIEEKDVDRTTVLAVPTPPEDKSYIKMLIECWINFGQEIFSRMDKINDYGTIRTHEIPTDMLFAMIRMTGILQHMVNSTSWNEGKLHKFDTDTLNKKLEQLRLSNGC